MSSTYLVVYDMLNILSKMPFLLTMLYFMYINTCFQIHCIYLSDFSAHCMLKLVVRAMMKYVSTYINEYRFLL